VIAMVVVFKIDREKLRIPVEDIRNAFRGFTDAVEMIIDDEKVLVIYFGSTSSETISKALGLTIGDVMKVREFEDKGKGRYLIYEGINRKGRYEKIEMIRE
jgi:hypothetical protein